MDSDGRVLAAFTGRKLRQMPPGFGICRVGESIVEPVVQDQGVRLLRALGFCGIAQVEFKRDPRDGTFRLMEVNPRSWSWIGLPLAIGCDLPYAQLCAATGFRLPENEALPTSHALWISLTHDLEWSLARRDGRPWSELLGLHDRIVESHFARDDPFPGWVNAGSFLADYAKRAGRKLGALIPAWTRASRGHA